MPSEVLAALRPLASSRQLVLPDRNARIDAGLGFQLFGTLSVAGNPATAAFGPRRQPTASENLDIVDVDNTADATMIEIPYAIKGTFSIFWGSNCSISGVEKIFNLCSHIELNTQNLNPILKNTNCFTKTPQMPKYFRTLGSISNIKQFQFFICIIYKLYNSYFILFFVNLPF